MKPQIKKEKPTKTNSLYRIIQHRLLLYPNLTIPEEIIKDLANALQEYYEEQRA